MSWNTRLGQLRNPVATYSALPITGNVLGDVRITTDTGDGYTWKISAASGALTDWKLITTSNFSDLVGSPSVTTLAIDDAVKTVKGLTINMAIMTFELISKFSWQSMRMFDGFVDKMGPNTDPGEFPTVINQGTSTGFVYLNNAQTIASSNNYVSNRYWYAPYRGDLDSNTLLLIHGDGVNGSTSFTDLLRSELVSTDATTDTAVKKFGTGSIKFNGTTSKITITDTDDLVFGDGNFTVDFWLNLTNVTLAASIYEQYVDADNYMKIHYTAAGKLVAEAKDTSNFVGSYETTNTLGLTNGVWNHIAVVRDGTAIVVYLNGVAQAMTENASIATNAVPNLDADITLGYGQEGYLNGNIDEIRISDTARYTGTFTPLTRSYNEVVGSTPSYDIVDASSSPHTLTPQGNARLSGNNLSFGNASLYLDGIDSYVTAPDSADFKLADNNTVEVLDSNSKLILHFDNNLTDSATYKTVTNNNVTFNASSKFGSHAASFNGTTGYLTIPDSSDFDLSNSDFTIDGWYNFSSYSASQIQGLFASWGAPANRAYGLATNVNANNTLDFFYILTDNSTRRDFSVTFTPTLNTWYHIAVVRSGANLKIFIDGAQVGSTFNAGTDTIYNSSSIFSIGEILGANLKFAGKMDEFRLSKGVARYTNAFIPATAAYDTATRLHLKLNNNLNDSATGKSITNYGVTFSADSKFGTHAGRVQTNTSAAAVADHDDFHFADGNFTVETWVKFYGTGRGCIMSQNTSPNTYWALMCRPDQISFALTVGGVDILYRGVSTSLSLNTWYHIAYVRDGGTLKIFINGVLQTLTTTGGTLSDLGSYSIPNMTGEVFFGTRQKQDNYIDGVWDEVRVSKGVARYTSNFTVPAVAFGEVSYSDFTVDCWVDPLSFADLNQVIMAQDGAWKLSFDGTSNHYVKFEITSGATLIAPISLALETWTHIAVVQFNGSLRLYINGILGASTAGTAIIDSASALAIGATSTGSNKFTGYIEEVRISNNARWTANFNNSLPSAEYANDANTKLLAHMNIIPVENMVLNTDSIVANYVPSSIRVTIFEEDIQEMEPNTDITAEVSRDGGTTWTVVVLAKDTEYDDGQLNIMTGSASVAAQPSGSLIRFRITTKNNKDCRIRGVGIQWR